VHIPDGYLGPQTYGAAYLLAAPFWAKASSVVRRTMRRRQVPVLALGAAFSFVIMLFNIPLPGGTSGHPVGAVLVAILVGPWAACIAVSTALIVQAVLFKDGGITTIGANCLNLAIIMPFVGYAMYRLIAGTSRSTDRRRAFASAVGGYFGLNAAALATAVELGIQPLIAHNAAGAPLYAPYPLKVALAVMLVPHLLILGFVEAGVTGLAVRYLQRTDVAILEESAVGKGAR